MATTTKDPRNLQIVDPVLTNIARQYRPSGFIADQVAPIIPVDVDAGQYPVFNGFFDDNVGNLVADRAVTPEIDFEFSTDSFLCKDRRLKVSVSPKEKRNANGAVKLEQSLLNRLLDSMALAREVRVANLLTKTTNGGKLNLGANAGQKWNVDAATIEADIKTAQSAIYDKIGQAPDTIVIPWKVAYEMAIQQDIREVLKYTVNGADLVRLGASILPDTIHGLNVIIPKGTVRNSANEGATETLTEIWSDSVRVLHVGQNAGWGNPSTAYTFQSKPQMVDRWDEKDPPVEYIRAWTAQDEKVCAPDAGYEIADVL